MRHLWHLLGIFVIASIFFALMVFVQVGYVLYEYIIPSADMTLNEWLESFQFWGTIGIGLSLMAGLVWYVLGQWWFKVDNWNSSDKRPIWFLLFLLPASGIVSGVILTSKAQEGAAIAYIFYIFNGLLSYYLETAVFSPSPFKYTPLGARKIRHW